MDRIVEIQQDVELTNIPWCPSFNSLRFPCVLCVSAVIALLDISTTEAQRSQRLRREKLKLRHDQIFRAVRLI